MAVRTDTIMQLRERTGAGVMDCKRALQESHGDIEKAIHILREKGAVKASRTSSREAREGLISSYIHTGGRLGVMLELSCETDFVARTDDFKNLAREMAMQIAAAQPQWISREDVAPEVIEQERDIYATQSKKDKKDEKIIKRIVDGKIEKFFGRVCLLEQAHIRDSSGKTVIKDLINAAVSKLGENIVIRRFIRYQLGGE